MSATITATGTWTPLNVNFAGMLPTGPNKLFVTNFQGEALKNQDLPELVQFIQQMAAGYGIAYNQAVALFQICVQALMNRENPTVRTAVGGSG